MTHRRTASVNYFFVVRLFVAFVSALFVNLRAFDLAVESLWRSQFAIAVFHHFAVDERGHEFLFKVVLLDEELSPCGPHAVNPLIPPPALRDISNMYLTVWVVRIQRFNQKHAAPYA
jgi:hypothetical protein